MGASDDYRRWLREQGYMDEAGNYTEAGDRYLHERQGYDSDGDPADDTPEEAAARAAAAERAREGTREMEEIKARDRGSRPGGDPGELERVQRRHAAERLAERSPTAAALTPKYDLLPDSVAGQAQADPRMVAAQMRALKQLEDWGSGRMTQADMARRDLMRRELAGDERRQRDAVTRSYTERGLGGSGLEQMSMLGAQQGMADRLSAQDLALQVAVQDRALRSIEEAGQMAGQGRDQSFGEAMGRGNAIDRFNMVNTDIRNRNEDRRTDAERDVYGMAERRTALETGQYSGGGGSGGGERNPTTLEKVAEGFQAGLQGGAWISSEEDRRQEAADRRRGG